MPRGSQRAKKRGSTFSQTAASEKRRRAGGSGVCCVWVSSLEKGLKRSWNCHLCPRRAHSSEGGWEGRRRERPEGRQRAPRGGEERLRFLERDFERDSRAPSRGRGRGSPVQPRGEGLGPRPPARCWFRTCRPDTNAPAGTLRGSLRASLQVPRLETCGPLHGAREESGLERRSRPGCCDLISRATEGAGPFVVSAPRLSRKRSLSRITLMAILMQLKVP